MQYNGNNRAATTFINSKGNAANTYTSSDATAISRPWFYRIKQLDMDGKYSYSGTVYLYDRPTGPSIIYPAILSRRLYSDKRQNTDCCTGEHTRQPGENNAIICRQQSYQYRYIQQQNVPAENKRPGHIQLGKETMDNNHIYHNCW
jgi:hypothetical protein